MLVASRSLSLSVTHVNCLCLLLCSRGKRDCVVVVGVFAFKGKVRGRLLIITNSIN